MYCPFFPLQSAVCFIILTYLVPGLFTFYIQGVLKLKKNNSGAKRLVVVGGQAYCCCFATVESHLVPCAVTVRHCKLGLWWNCQCKINLLTPNDPYSGRTAPLTSKRCILYIYSTNTGTEYFKHGIYSLFFPLQNAVCFIILTYLVPVLFTFYIQGVLKLKKNNSGAKRVRMLEASMGSTKTPYVLLCYYVYFRPSLRDGGSG